MMAISRETIGTLQRAVAVTAFDHYDNLRIAMLPDILKLAQFLPADQVEMDGLPDTFPVEWLSVFPQWREWKAGRIAQRAGMSNLTVRKRDLELTTSVKVDSLGSSMIQTTLGSFAQAALSGYLRDLVTFVADRIAENPVVYDGQNLFDVEHRPADGGAPKSNIVDATQIRSNPFDPTRDEVRAELEQIKERLIANSLHTQRYYKSSDFPALQVLARQTKDALHLEAINREEYVSEATREPNPWQGKLEVIRRIKPDQQLLSYDVIWPIENGPRPYVLLEARGPKMMRFDPNGSLDGWDKEIAYGTEAKVYDGPGMWETSCRCDYSSAGG